MILKQKFMVFAIAGLMFAAPVWADELKFKNVKTLKYVSDRDSYAYPIIWDAMTDTYKNTRYDKTNSYPEKPIIYFATFDLNGDGKNEYIARPIEDFHDEGLICLVNTLKCKFFVVAIEDGVAKNLAIITANSIDVGDQTINGYKTLKAFTMEDEAMIEPKKFGFYETFKFDTEKGMYVNAMIMPNENVKATKAE